MTIPETIHLTPEITTRFVAFGDGGSGLPAQQQIADQLIRQHNQSPYNLILLLGDNIYPNGDTIKYGENRFTALYKPLLDNKVQFKPILGNHDITGPLGVGYPALWMSNQRENMRFFGMPYPYYDFIMGDFHFFMLNTNKFHHLQRDWLIRKLLESRQRWKIVCGHHPVFSSGFHGSSTYLRKRLKPLLEAGGANLYLSAHEHDYERFATIDGITYIVSGGGGADLRKFNRPVEGSLVRKSEHHFLMIEEKQDYLNIQAINRSGHIIDHLKLRSSETYHRQLSGYR